MDHHSGTPYYKKISFNLINVTLLGVLLYLGQDILLPLFFAILLASLLLPLCNYLRRKKFPNVLSILLPLIISLALIIGLLYFLSTQIAHFLADLPTIERRLQEVGRSLQNWIADQTSVTIREQNQYIDETTEKVKTQGAKIVGQTVLSLTEVLSYFVLLPIYTFLILYYKRVIKQFLIKLLSSVDEIHVVDIVHQSRTVSQKYVGGLLIETCIVFTLNCIGFFILGIQYAIFLALMAALLNLVPYIGMIVANVLCMLITLVSSENLSDVLWVAIILALVQIFDNNIGMPLIVGNRVKINALVTIVGVLIGGALCGIPGMFLAIPVLAVLKVIFDSVPQLNAWGILLGENPSEKEQNE